MTYPNWVIMLMRQLPDRLNLPTYSKWEREFLANLLLRFQTEQPITPFQQVKLKEIVRRRWVQGESHGDTLAKIFSGMDL